MARTFDNGCSGLELESAQYETASSSCLDEQRKSKRHISANYHDVSSSGWHSSASGSSHVKQVLGYVKTVDP